MRIALVGPGRIGLALRPELAARGHDIALLGRSETGDYLSPDFRPEAAVRALDACDAALLLAGRFKLGGDPAQMLQTNFAGPVRIAEALHARFPRAVLVTFLDSRIQRPDAALPSALLPYLDAKRRLARWTLDAARAWSGSGARVNAIAPGPVLPPPDAAHREPAGACLTPRPTIQDLLAAVLLLLTVPSITGQILYVDAGQHLL